MQLYMKELQIQDVRGLSGITISLEPMQHLILTGKNGSGKTSVLNAIANYLNHLVHSESNVQQQGIDFVLNLPQEELARAFSTGEFIIAYYRDHRVFTAANAQHIEKVTFLPNYTINATPRSDFVKFLLDLKATAGMAGQGKIADDIALWFTSFEKLLQEIFEEPTLALQFDIESYQFSLKADGKPTFDFNTLSSGYGAVLDIVVDIMMRMQYAVKRRFAFDVSGIVLIDEIETHLHIDLQKNVMSMLTRLFPKIQFIITTHSPFILNALSHVVIYDLEKRLLVQNGLKNVSYTGIVEGYFHVDSMSKELGAQFARYQELVEHSALTEDDCAELARLEMTLEEIPDFLSLNIATEYKRLQQVLEHKLEEGNG